MMDLKDYDVPCISEFGQKATGKSWTVFALSLSASQISPLSSLSWEKAQFRKLRKKIGSEKLKGNHSNKALIRPFRKDY
uniref:Uncharacterized protein n=1 Tax=Brassica oleracea TaxID=3712 RepID=A0A3P6F5N0_BRAOL|nr:unnamed protein product [Brassica oleracea]